MKKNLVFPLLLMVMLLVFATPAFAGLGISPSDWVEPHSLVGQTMSKTFVVSRSDTEQDLYFTSEITGEIAPWITVENAAKLVISKGKQALPVKVTIAIPANTEFKEYKGEIRLRSQSNSSKGGNAPVGVVLSALIQIDLTVSDQLFSDFQVLQITIPDQQVNKPLNVILKIWNQGNVVVRPTKLLMDFFDKFNNTKLNSTIFSDFPSLPGVEPFSEGEIAVPIPFSLSAEQYWAHTAVYLDAAILKSDDVTFNLVDSFSSSKLGLGGLSSIVLLIVIIVVIGLIGLGIYLLRKKHKRRPRSSSGRLHGWLRLKKSHRS